MATTQYAVKVVDKRGQSVKFDTSPDLVETRNVNYTSIDPIHAPGQIFAYKNTSSRIFNLANARFISRNTLEAESNLIKLWRLRGWCMPEFGDAAGNPDTNQWTWDGFNVSDATAQNNARLSNDNLEQRRIAAEDFAVSNFGQDPLGTPPAVLFLSAYSGPTGQGISPLQQHLRKIPVVITQISIPYPGDVDYIMTPKNTPMPSIMTLDITFTETHSPKEYLKFNLTAFKQGVLPGF